MWKGWFRSVGPHWQKSEYFPHFSSLLPTKITVTAKGWHITSICSWTFFVANCDILAMDFERRARSAASQHDVMKSCACRRCCHAGLYHAATLLTRIKIYILYSKCLSSLLFLSFVFFAYFFFPFCRIMSRLASQTAWCKQNEEKEMCKKHFLNVLSFSLLVYLLIILFCFGGGVIHLRQTDRHVAAWDHESLLASGIDDWKSEEEIVHTIQQPCLLLLSLSERCFSFHKKWLVVTKRIYVFGVRFILMINLVHIPKGKIES